MSTSCKHSWRLIEEYVERIPPEQKPGESDRWYVERAKHCPERTDIVRRWYCTRCRHVEKTVDQGRTFTRARRASPDD